MSDASLHSPSSTQLPKFWALVPCAGTGTRAGGEGPKQYQWLAGRPMVEHTLMALAAVDRLDGILVVTAPDDSSRPGASLAGVRVVACGGNTRAATVANGLASLLQAGAQLHDWVLVHDAARCLVLPEHIAGLITACLPDAVGGLLAAPLVDTLKEEVAIESPSALAPMPARVGATRARAGKWLAQTPQMFRLGVLAQALRQAGEQVTDESSAIEALGLQPLLVACSAQNIKVTYPDDFALAEALLMARAARSTLQGNSL